MQSGNYNESIQGDFINIQGNQIYIGQDLSQFVEKIKEVILQLQNHGYSRQAAEQEITNDLRKSVNSNEKLQRNLLRWQQLVSNDNAELFKSADAVEAVINLAFEESSYQASEPIPKRDDRDERLNHLLYSKYEKKCQDYEQILREAATQEYPFSPQTEAELQEYRQHLSLRSEDWQAIDNRVLAPFAQKIKQTVASTSTKTPKPSSPEPPSTTTQTPSTEKSAERENGKSDAKDYQGAIADYDEAIRLQSDDGDVYFKRGNGKRALGDQQGAIADYTEAIRLQPDYTTAYINRGNAKRALGDQQGAIADYTEAIRLQPDYTVAYYNRGIVKSDLGDKYGAITDFTEVIRIEQNYAKAYNYRGNAKYDVGDKRGAIEDYHEAAGLYQRQDDAEGYRMAQNNALKASCGSSGNIHINETLFYF